MSVKQNPNGTWEANTWYVDWRGSRQRKHQRGFKTKREARAWEEAFKAKQQGSPTMAMADFWELYAQDRRPHLKLNTWRTKEHIARTKILPFFGAMRMSDITPADVMRWQANLLAWRDARGKGYSDTYLRTVSNELAGIFNHAVRYYGLPSNPVHKTGKIGAPNAPEMLFWTKEEYKRFSEEMMDKPLSFLIFEVLYWTGIREGEMLALTPSDFDLERRTLSVTRSYQRLDGQDVITGPKTPKSVRTIAIPAFLAEEVADHLRLFPCGADQRMFNVTKSYLYHEMERGCRASGVKRIRIHDLRHSHVSLLISLGFNALAIADRMGHESVDITYRYAHLFPSAQATMASALDSQKGEWK